MDNYVGKRIDGRYEIQEVIGVGGMAVVYKAYDTIDDRIVAVKILKEEYLANEEFRRKFKNESKAIAILNHPNIVKVYDVSFGERIQYIVMEYVDGITLKEYINEQGIIGWKEAVHFEMQILQALQHAHDKGIIHRDIKPQNIILLQDGSIKVADFGIARFARSETKTMTNGAIGSVHYISPEQAKGDYTDERADLYSAGVVLYEMITGKVPFNADSAVSIAIMQLQKEAEVPSRINATIPKGLEQITMHAMQKNPKERYQSAAEMLMDLKEISENQSVVFPYIFAIGEPYVPVKDSVAGDDEQNLKNMLEKEEDKEADELSGQKNDEYYREKYGMAKTKTENDPAKKKKIAIIVTVSVVAVALITVLCIILFGGEKITVPKFIGMNYNEQIAKYVKDDTYDDGKVKCKIKLEYTDDVDKYADYESGQVVFQSPDAGMKIKSNKTVTLTILSSSEGTKIPDIVGMNKSAAQIELKAKGFKNFKFEEKPDKDVAAGNVISTSPSVGTKVDKETKIIVYISSGSSFKMPSVIGMSKSDAEKFLSDYKLNITYTEEDSQKQKDTVLKQSIDEGEKTNIGDSLTLTVSSGNAPTTTTETTTQAEKSVPVKFKLPEQNGAGEVGGIGNLQVFLDGSVRIASDTITCDGSSYTVTATGSGTKELTVEVDNTVIYTFFVNFDNGTY
ncbi:MAG: Stk1 family PASTA domain-containing Ser/Thr kinase [Ruminococcaceae bacterium]|nr:Stk1 family PASTA domain-containing Ser/Thr kinase [Oscillospiraceae bacterium]